MNPKPTHLLITNDLGPHVGGIEVFLLGLLEELNKDLLPTKNLLIYTSGVSKSEIAKMESFDQQLSQKLGVQIIRDRSKILLPTPTVISRINQAIKNYPIEYIFYGATAPLALATRKVKAQNPQIKKALGITHGHEVWWAKTPIFKYLLKEMGRELDVITYLGNFTNNKIRKAVGTQVQMLQLAPGIDYEKFVPATTSVQKAEVEKLKTELNLVDQKVILCVGRLVQRKGQDILIKAMNQILQNIPEAHLLLVGVGNDEKRLKKILRAENQKTNSDLMNKVTFVGKVPYEKLPTYFQIAELFAMPARSRFGGLEVEGLGIVFLEASSAGLPIVVGNSGGASDTVLDGQTGLLVDGKNPNQVADAIIKILKDPNLGKQMGINGRNWVIENWNWSKWSKAFVAALH